MKHIGIITEYNPFHNGHQYQLKKVQERFPDKNIIIIMSGDFVQRGEPAVFNKYLRTQIALQEGADIVFELPSLFSTASAEHFACAAVLALSATGMVDTLCFGAENDDLNALYTLADLFVTEPEDYQKLLKENLKSGFSYPKARCLAAASYLQDDKYSDILRHPNNILGIEYLKAIQKYHLEINPVIIKREGNGYHDLSAEGPFSSASAIRQILQQPNADLHKLVPNTARILLQESPYAKPLFLSDFYPFLQYALWQNDSYEGYFEITKELSNKLQEMKTYPATVKELTNQLSGKNLTSSRIQRALLNLLLNRKAKEMEAAKKNGCISYLRLLGFRNPSAPLLKEMKSTCTVPVINKVANARKILSDCDYCLFQKDLHCSALYRQVFMNKYHITMPSEYEHSVIIEK